MNSGAINSIDGTCSISSFQNMLKRHSICKLGRYRKPNLKQKRLRGRLLESLWKVVLQIRFFDCCPTPPHSAIYLRLCPQMSLLIGPPRTVARTRPPRLHAI